MPSPWIDAVRSIFAQAIGHVSSEMHMTEAQAVEYIARELGFDLSPAEVARATSQLREALEICRHLPGASRVYSLIESAISCLSVYGGNKCD